MADVQAEISNHLKLVLIIIVVLHSEFILNTNISLSVAAADSDVIVQSGSPKDPGMDSGSGADMG